MKEFSDKRDLEVNQLVAVYTVQTRRVIFVIFDVHSDSNLPVNWYIHGKWVLAYTGGGKLRQPRTDCISAASVIHVCFELTKQEKLLKIRFNFLKDRYKKIDQQQIILPVTG